MSDKSKRNPPVVGTSPAAIISAVVVVLIVAGLGLTLFTTQPPAAPTAAAPTAAALEPTIAKAEPTSAPAAAPAAKKQYAQPDDMKIDPKKNYTATITTPRGDIVVKLLPDVAPKHVNSFAFLAKEGFYDGTTWHRVLPNFMAQGGDPTGTGGGGPGYSVPAEFSQTLKFDKKGILAMARANDPNSAGSQFFITTAPADYLDGKYTIFGEVIKGQEIVDGIPLRDPQQNPTTPGETILKVRVTEG